MMQERIMKIGFGVAWLLFIWVFIQGVREHNPVIAQVAFTGMVGIGILYAIWKLWRLLLLVGLEAAEGKHQVQGLAWYIIMRQDHPEELQTYIDRYDLDSALCGCSNCREQKCSLATETINRQVMQQKWGEDDAGEDNIFDRS